MDDLKTTLAVDFSTLNLVWIPGGKDLRGVSLEAVQYCDLRLVIITFSHDFNSKQRMSAAIKPHSTTKYRLLRFHLPLAVNPIRPICIAIACRSLALRSESPIVDVLLPLASTQQSETCPVTVSSFESYGLL